MTSASTFTVFRAAAAALLLGVTGCDKTPEQTPPGPKGSVAPGPETVVLTVDGLDVRKREIDEWEPYIRYHQPAVGRSTLISFVLHHHVLPTRFSEREFPAEREAAKVKAQEFWERVQGGGHPELASQGSLENGIAYERKSWTKLTLPFARWAFAKERLMAVSPPLAVPEGYQVGAASEYHDSLSTDTEKVDCYVVTFATTSADGFNDWWTTKQTHISTRCTYMHPSLKGALPRWLQPPSQTP